VKLTSVLWPTNLKNSNPVEDFDQIGQASLTFTIPAAFKPSEGFYEQVIVPAADLLTRTMFNEKQSSLADLINTVIGVLPNG